MIDHDGLIGPIAQWQSSRLITGQVLVRVQVGPVECRRLDRGGTGWLGSGLGPPGVPDHRAHPMDRPTKEIRVSGADADRACRASTRGSRARGGAARLPKQIEAIQAALAEAKKQLETIKARVDATRKELRAKEKDLEVIGAKRSKLEARLYEVKTNNEYSAVLPEIEEIKQEKAKTEEEILGLMELQERLAVEIREAETRLKTARGAGRQDEAVVRKKLAAVEEELAACAPSATAARKDSRAAAGRLRRILKARVRRGGRRRQQAAFCGGCRVSIRPQAIQELRSAITDDALRELRPLPLLAGPPSAPSPRPRDRLLGRCLQRQPGPGGWAASSSTATERVVSGAEPRTTNQRMELRAAIEGLAAIPGRRRVHLHTDSAYVVNCFRDRWWERWEKNGWLGAGKQPVANRDLWERLIAETRRHDVVWHKVGGHSRRRLNDRVDALARGAIAAPCG